MLMCRCRVFKPSKCHTILCMKQQLNSSIILQYFMQSMSFYNMTGMRADP